VAVPRKEQLGSGQFRLGPFFAGNQQLRHLRSGMAKTVFSASIPRPVRPVSRKPGEHKRGGDTGFGEEGTNKTQPLPQSDDAEPSAELQGTKSKYIPKSPYTRG